MPDQLIELIISLTPPAFTISGFCCCAIDESGLGCMRRPAGYAPRRQRSNRRTAGDRDDGGGDPDSAPRRLRAALPHRGRP